MICLVYMCISNSWGGGEGGKGAGGTTRIQVEQMPE